MKSIIILAGSVIAAQFAFCQAMNNIVSPGIKSDKDQGTISVRSGTQAVTVNNNTSSGEYSEKRIHAVNPERRSNKPDNIHEHVSNNAQYGHSQAVSRPGLHTRNSTVRNTAAHELNAAIKKQLLEYFDDKKMPVYIAYIKHSKESLMLAWKIKLFMIDNKYRRISGLRKSATINASAGININKMSGKGYINVGDLQYLTIGNIDVK